MFTKGYKELRTQYRLTYDGDLWGQAMSWMFAIADYLYHTGTEEIPESWQFRHGDMCNGDNPDDYEGQTIADLVITGEATEADVLAFGMVLDRYTNVLRLAGRDY